ncbi:hypothetical protein Tco_1073599 [Tanacetum coccineum]
MIKIYYLCANLINFANIALPPRYQRHQYLRYEGLQYTDVDIANFEMRLARIYKREVHRVQIPDKGDLRDYWIRISSTGDFLGTTPSYTSIRDLTLRMCHRLIACSIEGRSQAPEKVTVTDLFYLRGMDVGLVNCVARLAEHFGLLTEERLQGLIMIVRELPVIDMTELVRLKDAPIDDEGAMAVPAPVQAPQPPPPAAGPAWTMAQRLARVEEDMYEIRGVLVRLGSGTPAMQTFRSRMRGVPDAGLTYDRSKTGSKFSTIVHGASLKENKLTMLVKNLRSGNLKTVFGVLKPQTIVSHEFLLINSTWRIYQAKYQGSFSF